MTIVRLRRRHLPGGLLANAFGSEAYVRLTAERWSTFNGSFTQDFSAGKIMANNIRGYYLTAPPVRDPRAVHAWSS